MPTTASARPAPTRPASVISRTCLWASFAASLPADAREPGPNTTPVASWNPNSTSSIVAPLRTESLPGALTAPSSRLAGCSTMTRRMLSGRAARRTPSACYSGAQPDNDVLMHRDPRASGAIVHFGALGFAMREDAGRDWRRAVPSPEPREIVPLRVVAELLRAGTLVICSGGGGIPVVRGRDGGLSGTEAAIDKDLAAPKLAAGTLLMLTDVPNVCLDYGTPAERPLAIVALPEMGDLRGHRPFQGGQSATQDRCRPPIRTYGRPSSDRSYPSCSSRVRQHVGSANSHRPRRVRLSTTDPHRGSARFARAACAACCDARTAPPQSR